MKFGCAMGYLGLQQEILCFLLCRFSVASNKSSESFNVLGSLSVTQLNDHMQLVNKNCV